jgi:hypothetical protein
MRRIIGKTVYYPPSEVVLSPFENLLYHTLPSNVRRYLICHPSFIVKVEGTILHHDRPSFLYVTSEMSYILDARIMPVQYYEDHNRLTYLHVQDVSETLVFKGDPLVEIEKIPRRFLFFSKDDVRCIHESMRAHMLFLHRPDDPRIQIREYPDMKVLTFRYRDRKVTVRIRKDGFFYFCWKDHYYLGGKLAKME